MRAHATGRTRTGSGAALRKRRGIPLLASGCLILSLLTASATQASGVRRTAVVDVVERVRATVVNIHSERTAQGPANAELFSMAPSQNRINGMGTGVIIDSRGYIVTNHHVVEDVNVLRVRLSDGNTYTATVVSRDHEADLALLKIDAGRPLPTMPLGTARDLMVGETVIAIGNAYGYEHTVTVGVVSAIKRDVTLNKDVSYKALIQTDASINPGNSGGPLLNINGEMIGINVAIRAGAQGISFAIPVDTMIQATAEMLSVRKRNGVWHGLICRNRLAPESADIKSTSATSEAPKADDSVKVDPAPLKRQLIVERIESGSPAGQAGFQPGDILVRVEDVRVGSSLDLERALLEHSPGEHLAVVARRGGADQRFDLVLRSLEQAAPAANDLAWRKLGVHLRPIDTELVSRMSQQLHGGLAVTDVNPQSPADKAGIQRGDILVGLHSWETLTLDNVNFVLTHPDLANFNPLCFYIIRSGQIRRGWLQQVD
jgi:serine protease Do